MRTIKGQTMFCVPALLLFSIGGSAHLSLEKLSAPRTRVTEARGVVVAPQSNATSVGRARKMIASWYGQKFQGRRTSSGERFDPKKMTAAHRTLPLGSLVLLTSPLTGQSVVVCVNDRGPRIKGRDLDLSEAAAMKLGIREDGIAAVEATLIK